MSCSTVQLQARRNSDLKVRYVAESRRYNFEGMTPKLSIRSGPVEVLSVSVFELAFGSKFRVFNGEAVLDLRYLDLAPLVVGKPATESVTYSYDIVFTDTAGFNNWILGGEFVVLGVNDAESGGCGGCDDTVSISLNGECVTVAITGNSIGMIGDAPSDGTLYGRLDAQWYPVPTGGGGGIPDAPTDGLVYGRSNGDWLNLNLIYLRDAPLDGQVYARSNGAWLAVNYITDAPADGIQYARINNAWAPVIAPPPTSGVPFSIGANIIPALAANEVLFQYTFIEPVLFLGNFVGIEHLMNASPTVDTAYSILRVNDGAAIGTATVVGAVSVATSGVVTATTVTGSPVAFNAGDTMIFRAGATVDTDLTGSITLKGERI